MPRRGRVARHVFGVEQIGLVAASARHPLPAQVVAGQIAVKQMRHQPVGARAPVDAPHMHHIAGQPHAGVVVQRAGGIQRAHGLVDDGHAGAGLPDVGWQLGCIGCIGQWAGVDRCQDVLARMRPDMAKKFTPAQLEDQLVLHRQALALEQLGQHLGQGQQPVR